MTTARHNQGVSLIEVLFVASISAILVAGAATHFRTLRQASNVAHVRSEALQNARVAIDRMARKLRAATEVTKIKKADDIEGEITVACLDGLQHVFERKKSDEILYGSKDKGPKAEELLATGITSLRFQGFDTQGPVDDSDPELIEIVQITLSAAIGDTGGTIDLSTRVRLRNTQQAGTGNYQFVYADDYRTLNGGLDAYREALGAPDGEYAEGRGAWGARFRFLEDLDFSNDIQRIFVGLRLRYVGGGGFDLRIKRGNTTLTQGKYENVFDGYEDWGWWWIDISDTRSSWSDNDINRLQVEIDDSGGGELDFDSIAVLVCFGEPQVLSFWADREGGPNYQKEWRNASNAFGAPDDSYATGQDSSSRDEQSFRVTVPDDGGEILAVQVCINGYITGRARGPMDLRCALPAQGASAGVTHELPRAYLRQFDRRSKQGDMLADVTQDRRWTWSALDGHEIRIHVDTGSGKDLKADAVGWRVLLFPQGGGGGGGGVSGWSEQ